MKEEAEVTVPPARPCPSFPPPSPRTESCRLSATFYIISKERFSFFAAGNGNSKSPKGNLKTTGPPQVVEYLDVGKGRKNNTAATAKPLAEEVDAKDNVDGGAVLPAITTVGAAVPGAVGVSAAAVASAAEEVTPGVSFLPRLLSQCLHRPSLRTSQRQRAEEPVKDER